MQSGSPTLEEFAQQRSVEPLKSAASDAGISKTQAVFLSLVVVWFNAVGNLALAWGMKHLPPVGISPSGYIRAMANPFVATGIGLLILWLLTRMALMSWADLSFAQPLMAIGYVLAAVLGKFVLHEPVGTPQWIGILLIFAGSMVVGTTEHRTGEVPASGEAR